MRHVHLLVVLLLALCLTSCTSSSKTISAAAEDELDVAIRNGDVARAKEALSAGANPRAQRHPSLDIAQIRSGRKLEDWFGIFIKRNQLMGVRFLRYDPAMCASAGKRDERLKADAKGLLEKLGTKPKSMLADVAGELRTSRLHIAALLCQPGIIDTLAAAGSDVDAKDGAGLRPLHWASCAPATRALIAHRANVRATSEDGLTPLHFAIDRETVRVLVAAGADREAKDACGNRPVHTAAWFGLGYGASAKPAARGASREDEVLPRWAVAALDLSLEQLERLTLLMHERFDVVGELIRAGAKATKNAAGHDACALGERAHSSHDWD